ncbi:MAG: Stress response protein SCP2 [Lentisphaerae bacterium ADurb.Bin242]|nr:MAG: Stress response protein SCP2 [Lentisphaerae bacterium ADurb.Bin242]
MAINLNKGQRINLEKENGSKLERFCVGCNWGAITTKGGFFGLGTKTVEVDLDLSCVMFDTSGNRCDFLYSPLYTQQFLMLYGLLPGKLDSLDGALHHTGDDRSGDTGDDDGLDNEIITVDLKRVSPDIMQIFFFLNNCGKEDFSQIPYASIRMFEGTPEKVQQIFASYNVAAETAYQGKTALVMGELYKHNGAWKFNAIGDAYPHRNLGETINLISKQYVRR